MFREHLSLKRILSEHSPDKNNSEYKLYAVIVHYGRTIFGGHYVAFVREGDEWLLCDDEKVKNFFFFFLLHLKKIFFLRLFLWNRGLC